MERARLVASVLAAAASVTTVVGSTLPLFTVAFNEQPDPVELTFTPWQIEIVGAVTLGDAPANGYPLVFAAVVLAVAAVLCRAASRPGARTVRAAGVVTAVGAAFLACAVWLVAAQVAYWSDMYDPQDASGAYLVDSESSYMAGLWVLVFAAVLGVAAAVPALLPATPAVVVPEVVDPDAPTPPFGIALPVPAEEVDPLTGEPVGEPPPPPPPPVRDEPIVLLEAPPPEPLKGPAIPLTDDPLAEPRGD